MQVLCLAILGAAVSVAAAPPVPLPVYFEPNQGQTDAQVKFLARNGSSTLWFTERGPVLGVSKKGGQANLRMRFEGGKRSPLIEPEGPLPGISNYFSGVRGEHTNIPHFSRVRYRDVYPGIDVEFYATAREVEYDFLVAPGADPSRIRLAFDGADRLTQEGGDLVATVGGVEIRHRKPVIRQTGRILEGRFHLLSKHRAAFSIDAYDCTQPLVIDPVLTYATYLGGADGERTGGMAIDAQGNIVMVGFSTSPNFPEVNSVFTYAPPLAFESPSEEAFIVKFNPAASGAASLVFSTLYESKVQSSASAVALDNNGNIYFTGRTYDGSIPLKNAFQNVFADDNDCPQAGEICPNAFVAELNSAGNQLLFSSLLGGTNYDTGTAIAVDASGNIYVAGDTQSSSFPRIATDQLPYQNQIEGSLDGFLTMIGPARTIVYSTLFGSGTTNLNAVAVDAQGQVYLAGTTTSGQLLGTAGAYQRSLQGTSSGMIAVFNLTLPSAQSLVYYTYLGGASGGTTIYSLALDSAANIYVGGGTTSSNFPATAGGARTTYVDDLGFLGLGDGFVAKLMPSATGNAQLLYSTFVGGSFDDWVTAIAVDSAGRITATGVTDSFDFPVTPDAFQCCYDGFATAGFLSQYGFVARFDPSKTGAASQTYSTLVGGTTNTNLSAIASDAPGNTIAVGGYVQSNNTPVTSTAFQPKFGGENASGTGSLYADVLGDSYMARFDFTTSGPALSIVENGAGLSAITSTTLSPGLIFTIKGTGLGPAVGAGAQLDPSTGLVANKVQGVQVLVDGVPAPLIYVSATQINAIAPYEIAAKVGGSVFVQPVYNGVLGSTVPVAVAATAPAIFSFDDGSGQGAILNQDQSINGAANPASIGSVISLYATGEGQTVPAGVDGALATEPLAGIPRPAATSSVTIGGINAPIQYIGTAPGGVAGFLQVNVTVPAGVATGASIPVVLTINSVASPKTLTMAIH